MIILILVRPFSEPSSSEIMTLDNPISDEEIQKILFSLKDNKAPIPDGFNAGFLKKAWTIIGLTLV